MAGRVFSGKTPQALALKAYSVVKCPQFISNGNCPQVQIKSKSQRFNATTECGILPAGVASIAVNVFLDANIYRPVEATVDSESGSRMQR